MMDKIDYGTVYAETDAVLNNFQVEMLAKIPKELIEQINKRKNSSINVIYDNSKPLKDQNFSQATKNLISAIYLKYCVTRDKRKEIIKTCYENEVLKEQKLNEKFNTQNLFKNNTPNNIQPNSLPDSSTELMTIEKHNWYDKLILGIKNFLKKFRK